MGIANPDGTNVQRLAVFGYAFCPHPDGSKIVLSVNGSIATVNSDGSGLPQLTATNQDEDPIYRPDGTKIIYVRSDTGTFQGSIYTVNPHGSGEAMLIVPPVDTFDTMPRYGNLR